MPAAPTGAQGKGDAERSSCSGLGVFWREALAEPGLWLTSASCTSRERDSCRDTKARTHSWSWRHPQRRTGDRTAKTMHWLAKDGLSTPRPCSNHFSLPAKSVPPPAAPCLVTMELTPCIWREEAAVHTNGAIAPNIIQYPLLALQLHSCGAGKWHAALPGRLSRCLELPSDISPRKKGSVSALTTHTAPSTSRALLADVRVRRA